MADMPAKEQALYIVGETDRLDSLIAPLRDRFDFDVATVYEDGMAFLQNKDNHYRLIIVNPNLPHYGNIDGPNHEQRMETELLDKIFELPGHPVIVIQTYDTAMAELFSIRYRGKDHQLHLLPMRPSVMVHLIEQFLAETESQKPGGDEDG